MVYKLTIVFYASCYHSIINDSWLNFRMDEETDCGHALFDIVILVLFCIFSHQHKNN